MTEFSAYPKRLLIEFTDRCNLKCFICVREEYESAIGGPGQFIDMERLRRLEKPIAHAESIQINGFGETFLHPRLKEFLDYIYSVNPNDNLIKCVSNGTALSGEKAGWLGRRLRSLHISLNASNAESYWREMHPYEHAAGKDVRFKFEQLINKIRDFADALEPEDRRKIHLHYVCHRDNFADMAAYVRLAARLGLSNVMFTPYKANRPQFIERCLYWDKEAYNDAADEALEAGEQLGVSVVARKFFSESGGIYIPERDCRWVNEEAQLRATGKVMVCCPSEYEMDGNAFDAGGFEAIWFGEQYARLRKERFLPACKVCNELVTFDDLYTHFEHNIKLDPQFGTLIAKHMDEAGRLEQLYGRFLERRLDFDLYRKTSRTLGIPLQDLAAEPPGQLFSILETLFRDGFLKRAAEPRDGASVRLAGPFLGYGWGGFEKNVHGQSWRWVSCGGGEQRAVLLVTLQPGRDYSVETLIHTAPIAHYLRTLTVYANDHPALDQRVVVEGGLHYHRCRIPADALGADGRLRLAFDAGDPALRKPDEYGLALTHVTLAAVAPQYQ